MVSTHSNLCDIDVAVSGGRSATKETLRFAKNFAEVLLADALTLGHELSDSPEKGRLLTYANNPDKAVSQFEKLIPANFHKDSCLDSLFLLKIIDFSKEMLNFAAVNDK